MQKFNLSTKTLLIISVLLFIGFNLAAFMAISTNIFKSVFKSSYSFQLLQPGISTSEDIEKTLGKPEATENINGETKLIYSTKSLDHKDTIVLENNKLKYSIEKIFDSSMGTLSSYKAKYGNPNLVLFDPEDDVLVWSIFLNAGIGIATFDGNEIAKILYFKPQELDEFMINVASPIGLSKEKVIHSDE